MDIRHSLQEKILILDGAMGTRIQALGLDAEHFHRGPFSQWPVSLAGNNDVLCMTAPEAVAQIHRSYIDAGADIISTNTFSSNRISQHEYGCESFAAEMARCGAQIARRVADQYTDRKIWVAGSMGPTSKSLTLASDMEAPAVRAIAFDDMSAAYYEQAAALMDGGCDLLLIETCFDALNVKAALYAVSQLNEQRHTVTPVMVSATINDHSGRTLTGQTLEAFYISISHYPILSFGLNCSFGVTDLAAFVERLSARIPAFLSLHPNAGLPNEMGEYEELPEFTASHLRQMAEAGWLNIAGGCCGTDERHIRAISRALKGLPPRQVPEADERLWLSGLEPLLVDLKTRNFTNVGERTNVAGSRKFARLIGEKKYEEALQVARQQIEGGAGIIDINMDDAMLDSKAEMQTFCRYMSADPAVGRATWMIDSSDWDTILAGLKNAQGKCVVNSISLKNGEKDFLTKAAELRRLGAAVVVMAFDEEGQATTYERKIGIARRAYALLTENGFPPQDIIFDVNILSVGTGLKEHQAYAIDFIRAVEWMKQHLPKARTSGGVSNLSFAFRGNNRVREAMHSVFLYHAIRSGLDMAIVNPSMLQVYDDIPTDLLHAVEDVILNTDNGATERLTTLASALLANVSTQQQAVVATESWRAESVEERLAYALTKGDTNHIEADMADALKKYGSALRVIEGPLMQAMGRVGEQFGQGKMFLPQVVKSAQVMKTAVGLLQPYIEADKATAGERPRIVLATANGDVHDIGKNIVSIVLSCNNFDIVDLGVMVPNEKILEATLSEHPVLVGISGLITPSLKEMELLCRLFQQHRLKVPIVVGGATTSALHTAVKLAPLYDGLVVYGGDASQTSLLAKQLQISPDETSRQIKASQELICKAYEEQHTELTPYEEANRRAPQRSAAPPSIAMEQLQQRVPAKDIPLSQVLTYIDWRMFLLFWGFKGETLQQLLVNPEAEKTLNEGRQRLADAVAGKQYSLQALVTPVEARRRGNDILLSDDTVLPMLRQQSRGHQCLSDYFDEETARTLCLFTTVAQPIQQATDEPQRLMDHALCARLTEACAEWLEQQLYSDRHVLRAAFGYATCPDHSLKRIVCDRQHAEALLGITLTDHYSIQPSTAICGLFIEHPDARYFPVGRIGTDQLHDYCRRRGITMEEGERLLSKYIKS